MIQHYKMVYYQVLMPELEIHFRIQVWRITHNLMKKKIKNNHSNLVKTIMNIFFY